MTNVANPRQAKLWSGIEKPGHAGSSTNSNNPNLTAEKIERLKPKQAKLLMLRFSSGRAWPKIDMVKSGRAQLLKNVTDPTSAQPRAEGGKPSLIELEAKNSKSKRAKECNGIAKPNCATSSISSSNPSHTRDCIGSEDPE